MTLRTMVFILIALVLVGSFARAELADNCKYLVKQTHDNQVKSRQTIQAGLKSGEISKLEASELTKMSNNLMVSAVATCVGLKMAELQHSFFGQIGLISREHAAQIGKETADEAMAYYRQLEK